LSGIARRQAIDAIVTKAVFEISDASLRSLEKQFGFPDTLKPVI
jgi:hypothetical protein